MDVQSPGINLPARLLYTIRDVEIWERRTDRHVVLVITED